MMMIGRKEIKSFPKRLTAFFRAAIPRSHDWQHQFLSKCPKCQSRGSFPCYLMLIPSLDHIPGTEIKILRTNVQSFRNSTNGAGDRWSLTLTNKDCPKNMHSSLLICWRNWKVNFTVFAVCGILATLIGQYSTTKIVFAKLWSFLLFGSSGDAESHVTWCDSFSSTTDDWAWCENCWVTFYDSCYAGGQTRWS